MASNQTTAGLLYKFMTILSEELDIEMPLTQVMAFARVALAGDAGLDQATLQRDLSMNTSSASRTIQALSAVHYYKDRPGMDVIVREVDAQDLRRRNLRLTSKGEKLMAKLQATL